MTTLKIAFTFCTVKIFSNSVLNGWISFIIVGFAILSSNNQIFKHTQQKGVTFNIQSWSATSVKHFSSSFGFFSMHSVIEYYKITHLLKR